MATKKKKTSKKDTKAARTKTNSDATSEKVRALANTQSRQAAELSKQGARIQTLTVTFTILCVLFAVVAYVQYMR